MPVSLILKAPNVTSTSPSSQTYTVPTITNNIRATSVVYTIAISPFIAGVNLLFTTLLPSGQNWTFSETITIPVMTNTLILPVGVDATNVLIDVQNASGVTINYSFYVGITLRGDATKNDDVYSLGNNMESSHPYPQISARMTTDSSLSSPPVTSSIRSTKDTCIVTNTLYPENARTLEGATGLVSLSAHGYQSIGNIPPTTDDVKKQLTIPLVSSGEYVTIIPPVSQSYLIGAGYIIDVDTASSCHLKFGALKINVSPTDMTMTIGYSTCVYLFVVTSPFSVDGTIRITLFGNIRAKIYPPTSTEYEQAAQIADLVNTSPSLGCIAVATGNRVYVRSIACQADALPELTGSAGVTVDIISIMTNTGQTESTEVNVTNYQRPIGAEKIVYRLYVYGNTMMCFRMIGGSYPSFDCCGSIVDDRLCRVGDSDLVVYNDELFPQDVAQSLNIINVYSLNNPLSVAGSYNITRTQATWTQTSLYIFYKASTLSIATIKSIAFQFGATTPTQIDIIENADPPLTSYLVTEYIGNMYCNSDMIDGPVTGGRVVRSFLVGTGTRTIDIDLNLTPFVTYTIFMTNDPAASSKTGLVGVSLLMLDSTA